MLAGDLEVELVPQGTLIERIRAGGYGLGGILTQTGLGTSVENGKTTVEVDGRSYLVEPALRADFALCKHFSPIISETSATRLLGAQFQSGHCDGRSDRHSQRRQYCTHRCDVARSRGDLAPLVDFLVANM